MKVRRVASLTMLLTMLLYAMLLCGMVLPTNQARAATPEVISALISQDQFVAGTEGSLINLSLTLSGRDPASTSTTNLVITSYRPVRSRQEVRDAVDGKLPSTIDTVIVDVSNLRNIETGRVDVAVPIEIGVRTKEALQMSASGLYPVSIGLQENKTVTSQVVTFVERLAQDLVAPLPTENLNLALTGLLDAPVTLQPDTTTSVDEISRASIIDLLATLEGSPSLPLSIAIRPELIEALGRSTEEDAALLARLQAVTSLHLVPSTYVDVLPDRLVATDRAQVFTDQLRLGEDVLESGLPNRPVERDSWIQSSALFSGGAQLLRNLGLRTVVLLGESQRTTAGGIALFAESTRLVELSLANRDRMTAGLADINLSSALTRGSNEPKGGAYLVAQQILAELKMLRFELVDRDETTTGRGVILATDTGELPSNALVTALTSTLASQPDISFVPLDELLNSMTVSVMDGLPVSIDLPATEAFDDPSDASITEFANRVAGYATMLPDGDERPVLWQKVVNVLPSRTLTSAQIDAYIVAVDTQLAALGASIVSPTATTFTLGGRDSSIRLSLRNDNATDLIVRIRLSSAKLTLPNDEQVLSLPAGTTTSVEIPVTAKSNGRFPVYLQLLTPAGDIPIGPPAVFTARVNALAGLGQLFSGIGLLLLLSWWIHHLRREHQRKQIQSTDSPVT